MRLAELQPRWFDVPGAGGARDGVSFLCPCCQKVRLAIQFTPMGVDEIHDKSHQEGDPRTIIPLTGNVWQRSGEEFETLTLTPSVDVSGIGHWHGHITAGEVK